MEGSDNIMNILKSLTPIKYTYSKSKKAIDESFKHMSLQNLVKHLDYRHKYIDEFSPSPEFLKQENKYDINFRNSNAYIKELSDLNNLPLIANKKNNEKKIKGEEDYIKKEKESINKRYRKSIIFKKKNSKNDSLVYNPNYNYIKKKIYCAYIRPPHSFIDIRKNIQENKKDIKKKNNSSIEKNQNENSNNNEQNLEEEQNKNQGVISSNKNRKQNNSIEFNTNNQNISNNSIFNESYSNRSNSSKNYNKCKTSKKNSKRKYLRLKGKLANLKNFSNKNFKKKTSLSNSDCYTMEINKSTNLDDISHIFRDKEKILSLNSVRNISSISLKFPKIKNIIHRNSSKKIFNGSIRLRYSLSFKKMLGREKSKSKEKNAFSYNPNYDFFRPHIHSTFFSYKNSDENYKKYKTGKIIRGYNYSPDDYFVCEFKKKKPIKFNINKERQKILELLRKKSEQ